MGDEESPEVREVGQQGTEATLQSPRRSDPDQLPHEEPEIEASAMNE